MSLTIDSETMTLRDKIDLLRGAGFRIRYAPIGKWSWSPGNRSMTADVWGAWERCPNYIHCLDVQDTPGHNGAIRAYVDLAKVGKSECQAGQSTTLDRSNFRSLIRDYPDMFTPTSYSNVDTLGAYVGCLTPEVVSILVGLTTDYLVYDESGLSNLEDAEITASFDQYVRYDVRAEMPESYQGTWDGLSAEQQSAAFWSAVEASDYYPEHNGLEVLWRYEEIMPALIDAVRNTQTG